MELNLIDNIIYDKLKVLALYYGKKKGIKLKKRVI